MLKGKKYIYIYRLTIALTALCLIAGYTFPAAASSLANAPQEGQKIGYSGKFGEVIENTQISENTLQLNKKYRDRIYLELDLDEIMGYDVRERIIMIPGYRNDRLGQLKTISKWSDISLYGVVFDSQYDKDEIEVRLGRIPASVNDSLKSKLGNWEIKSELIEADGINCLIDRVVLKIPYRQSDGNNLKVLRYDNYLRNWFEIPFAIDYVNQNVTVNSYLTGVFVVVGQ
jgi:hypothetical protein